MSKIGICLGVYDCLHVGHLRFLERAHDQCEYLVVLVVDDEAVRAEKGPARPIIPLDQRLALIQALKCVDATLIEVSFNPTSAVTFLSNFSNDLVFFRGDDQDHVPTDHLGIPVIVLPRTPGVSTTDITGVPKEKPKRKPKGETK